MKIRATQSKVDEAPASQPEHSAQSARSLLLVLASECILVAVLLLVAAVLRLTLASRGWPYSNSDEATTGLMVDDIIWHGAHPFFTYGEHHVGSLDAYLQVPAFLLFGATNFALHITTTIQILLFLLVFYGFTRAVYSPLVAGVTLALLAFGPYQQLFYGLRAGHYAQDMLLLSVLLMSLVVLRLRRPARAWTKWTLDIGIGLVAGLALWSTILLLPFVLAAALALGTLLLIDQGRPYQKALCRCKLPRCERFYLARRNPKGGPANRTYCTSDHRDEHHDSAERRAAIRKAAARHK